MAEQLIRKGNIIYRGEVVYPRTSADMIEGLDERLNEANNHTRDTSNPHQVTLHQAAIDLSNLPKRLGSTTTFKAGGDIYVRHDDQSYRMTLGDVKNMNTKILVTNDIKSLDLTKLTVNDIIYEEVKE